MRKPFAILLALLLSLCLFGCGGNNTGATDEGTTDGPSVPVVDENLLAVDITLPATYFKDMTAEEITNKASENGYLGAVVNADGSVTYTMTKAKWREALVEYATTVDQESDTLLNGDKAVASFKEITRNADMSEFTVKVDSATYSQWDTMYALAFYFEGNYYQIWFC